MAGSCAQLIRKLLDSANEGEPMSSRRYVSEKIYAAVLCLCEGDGSFTQRAESATTSSLIRLNREDFDAAFAGDLEFVLGLTSENMEDGHLIRELDYGERRRLVEAMLRILVETNE